MVCRHCGKQFADDAKYCPYCAEPVPKAPKSLEQNYIDTMTNRARFWSIFGCVILQFLALLCMGPLLGLVFGACVFPVSIWAIMYRIHKDAVEKMQKNDRRAIIDKQFVADQTSICPECGSHNIKVYRQGYDYRPGFWGSVAGVRGAGYVGGFDANNARCRCMNCGHDWETKYDYRLIK